MSCDKPVGEGTASEILGCGWSVIKDSVVSVINHPGGANVTEWIVTLFAALVVLLVLARLIRR